MKVVLFYLHLIAMLMRILNYWSVWLIDNEKIMGHAAGNHIGSFPGKQYAEYVCCIFELNESFSWDHITHFSIQCSCQNWYFGSECVVLCVCVCTGVLVSGQTHRKYLRHEGKTVLFCYKLVATTWWVETRDFKVTFAAVVCVSHIFIL